MHNDAGEPIGVVVLLTSLSARNVSVQLLGDVLEATSPKVGQDYIHAVANQLCRSCQVKYAMIGELDTNTSDMIHALAVSMDGEPMKEFSYSLTDTPCSVVIEGDICYYPERVQDLFRGS